MTAKVGYLWYLSASEGSYTIYICKTMIEDTINGQLQPKGFLVGMRFGRFR